MMALPILSPLFSSTNDAIPFQPIKNKSGVDLLCPAFYVPTMLRRVDLYPELEFALDAANRALAGYSNALAADDRQILDLQIVTNADRARLAHSDLLIRASLGRGVAAGLCLGLFLSGALWIVSSALTPSSSYPAVPIVLGVVLAGAGGAGCVIFVLPEVKKKLQ